MYARVSAAAIAFLVACTGAGAASCSHPKNIAILHDLGSEVSVGKVLDLLKRRGTSIAIWYKADARATERATTAANLSSLKYHSLDVSVVFPFPAGFIVSTDERLSFAFNSQGVLTGWSCKKEYTGP